jgi:hypothetical protein
MRVFDAVTSGRVPDAAEPVGVVRRQARLRGGVTSGACAKGRQRTVLRPWRTSTGAGLGGTTGVAGTYNGGRKKEKKREYREGMLTGRRRTPAERCGRR